jgi:prepilin-type N-terminal cleavage/methylation domain-containing protein
MKIENSKLKIAKHDAFTLIEILVAIAIVGILAAVVMVSMQSYAKKARASRALAQASSVIPSLVSCAGNYSKDDVNFSGQICDSSANYGTWPTWPSSAYAVASNNPTPYYTSSSDWVFKVTVESGDAICCNSTMNSCGQPTVACDKNATW